MKQTQAAHDGRDQVPSRHDYGLEEAALVLDLAPSLLALRIEAGDIPARHENGDFRIRATDLQLFKHDFDREQQALRALIEDSEDLMANHGV